MSHWNHRVIRTYYPNAADPDEREMLGVYETFYNDEGEPFLHSAEPDGVQGSSIEEMREYLQWMMNCLDKPILDAVKDFPARLEGE